MNLRKKQNNMYVLSEDWSVKQSIVVIHITSMSFWKYGPYILRVLLLGLTFFNTDIYAVTVVMVPEDPSCPSLHFIKTPKRT